jgi:hypothetical protein
MSWKRWRRTRSSGEKSRLGIHEDHEKYADHHLVMGSIQQESIWVMKVMNLQQSAEQQRTALLTSSTDHGRAGVQRKYKVVSVMKSFITTQQQLRCIESVVVQYSNNMADRVKGYVRRLTPAE